MKIEDLIYAACRGGWPAFLNMKSDKAKLLIARNYVDAICRDDISRVDGVQRDERTTRAILRSYARNISKLAKNTALLADVTASSEVSLYMSAFEDYVTSLNKLFVIDNIEAWCPAVHCNCIIRTFPKSIDDAAQDLWVHL